MTTTTRPAPGHVDDVAFTPSGRRHPARLALFVSVPVVWAVVALVHPVAFEGTVYRDLQDQVGLWMGVHFAQLVLAVGLAAALHIAVRGRDQLPARVTRVALPIFLVAFASFDSVAGLGTGLAVKNANGLDGGQREAAGTAAEYLLDNRFAGDMSVVWLISGLALVTAIAGAAFTLREIGAPRRTWILVLVGTLTAMHMGPPAALGLLCLGAGLVGAQRSGHLLAAPARSRTVGRAR
jgi:hypothetical protein